MLFSEEFLLGMDKDIGPEEKEEIATMLDSNLFMNEILKLAVPFGVDKASLLGLMGAGMVNKEMGIPRMAVNAQPGQMIPYARFNGTELHHRIIVFTGTDYGICAEINPYTFNYTLLVDNRPPGSLVRNANFRRDSIFGLRAGLSPNLHSLQTLGAAHF